jgi:hypothetical protein
MSDRLRGGRIGGWVSNIPVFVNYQGAAIVSFLLFGRLPIEGSGGLFLLLSWG